MTSIGDVIQPGEDIPDDVTEVDDDEADNLERLSHWVRTAVTVHGEDWRCVGTAGPLTSRGDMLSERYGPLTVTAVREQPADPERRLRGCVENWPEAETGSYDPRCCRFPKSCSATVYDEDAVTEEQLEPAEPEPVVTPVGRTDPDTPVLAFRSASGRTEVARRAEGFSVHVLHGSDRLTTDEARRLGAKLARYPDATPEPQQADASPVLDLVRQYGHVCWKNGNLKGKPGEAEAFGEVQDLFARIAALVPQQPVQARKGPHLWWIHGCGRTLAYLGQPGANCTACLEPGPWRPLLVGGDPAPEGGILAHARKAFHERDKAIAQLNQMQENGEAWQREAERLKLQVNAEIEQADEHAAWADRLAWAALKRTGVRETEEASGNEELWQLALDALTAQPDPLVLSLSTLEPPPGTVALIGKSMRVRYAREATSPVTWRGEGYRDAFSLLEVFQDSGPELEVELAPPREPRTWPALKPGPDPVDLPQYVTVEGWGSYGRREDGLYANTDGYPDDVYRGSCLTFAALRALGDVTEVTE